MNESRHGQGQSCVDSALTTGRASSPLAQHVTSGTSSPPLGKPRLEVRAKSALTAAGYDVSQLGVPDPDGSPVGLAVTEVVASVSFLLRLLIGGEHRDKGPGRAATVELLRRLRLDPDI